MDTPTILHTIDPIFNQFGTSVRSVGGGVRDRLLGMQPKDEDLATDARPDQVAQIAARGGWECIPTGVAHGTWTLVVCGQPIEVTSLRHEPAGHDRSDIPQFTTDWEGDAARRDLTINAMMIDRHGKLYDWFGGRQDLKERRLAFVGNAGMRIDEDPLRILRYIRMASKFPGTEPVQVDDPTLEILVSKAPLLRRVSAERIWNETKGILSKPPSLSLLDRLPAVAEEAGIPPLDTKRATQIVAAGGDAVEVLASAINSKQSAIAKSLFWKTSQEERVRLVFLAENASNFGLSGQPKRTEKGAAFLLDHLADGVERGHVLGLARVLDLPQELAQKKRPVFPIGGKDLLVKGHQPGKAMGQTLAQMRHEWKLSGYQHVPSIPEKPSRDER